MAANEDRTALWRTPLSTPIRSNENGFQDLFKHSEKLLASAVSICRLKGSVECQTGGIITVCEEMQRLLRLAFNETGRLEKELKKQRQTYDEEISLLKERLTYLEDTANRPKSNLMAKKDNERLPLKPSTSENTLQDDVKDKTPLSKVRASNSTIKKSPETPLTNENTAQALKNLNDVTKQDENMEEQDKMDEDDLDDLSLEIPVFDFPKETKPKTNSKTVSSNKKPQETGPAKGRKSRAKKTILSKESDEIQEPSKDSNVQEKEQEKLAEENPAKNSKREKPNKENKVKENKAKKRSTSKPRDNKINNETESALDANDSSSSDVFLNPESGLLEMKECSESSEPDSVEHVTKQKKATKTNPTTARTEKAVTKDSKPKKNTKKETAKQKEKLPKKSNAEAIISTFLESPKKNCASSPIKSLPESPVGKTETVADTSRAGVVSIPKSSPHPSSNEPDEVLGDVSFLIDISSMISSFVSGSESKQLELPLMQARERADARKLAGLFNLHISIGNKSENRSSLILSKTPNSQMPRPGKLDNMLSKLSIAATKEAERLSSKARTMKRKVTDLGEDGGAFDTDSQSKRGGKSNNKKAKI